MFKCVGCGVKLQSNDKCSIGYCKDISNKLCERCFRIKNYNEYLNVSNDNIDYSKILEEINKTNELVVLVVDVFNINKNIMDIKKYIKNDILLVLSKRDILPKSCYDKKIIEYFKDFGLNIVDTVLISSKKNINFDILFDKINYYKKSKDVYVVGFTNAGKSTMINKIIYNYSLYDSEITTSNIPSTTIDFIKVKVNDSLVLIDTPGIIDNGDICNYIEQEYLNKIQPKKEIRPITYQIKGNQYINIDNVVIIEAENVNITLYISNELNIIRKYKRIDIPSSFYKSSLKVDNNSDIVIQGFGFINIQHSSTINVYTYENTSVYCRKELI